MCQIWLRSDRRECNAGSAGSRLRGARGILLSAGPLRRGLATFATSTGAREPVRGKDKLSSQGLKEDGNFNRLILFLIISFVHNDLLGV